MGNVFKNVLRLWSGSSDPSSGQQDGDLWYNSTDKRVKARANGSTVSLATTAEMGTPAPYVVYGSGRWFTPQVVYGNTATVVMTLNRQYFVPVFLYAPMTIAQFGVQVSSASASGTLTFAIYGMDSNGAPGTRLYVSSTVSSTTTGFKSASPNQAMSAGWCFMSVVAQGVTCSVLGPNMTGSGGILPTPRQGTTQQTSINYMESQDGVTGTPPNPAVSASAQNNFPLFMFQAA